MRDSVEEDLFRGVACAHVQHGGQVAFELEHSSWMAYEVQGKFIVVRETVPVDPTRTDTRSYGNADTVVDAFMEQLHLQGRAFSDVVFKRVVGRVPEAKIEEPWGVTWRHLIARMDVLRMILLDDRSIMSRIFEEAKNL